MFFRKNKKGAKRLAPKNRKKMSAHINIFKQANLGVFSKLTLPPYLANSYTAR